MRNQKYYYLEGDMVRWTIWLDRDEDWGRANNFNYYTSRWLAENARAMRKPLKRIFVRKGTNVWVNTEA